MMKKQISAILLLALLLSAVSCGDSGNKGNTTGDTTKSDTGSVTDTPSDGGILATLTPALKEELGLDEYEFNVMLRDSTSKWSIHDLVAEEENGDVLNDATYKRNLFLEDNYGFTIKANYSADASLTEISTLILSGDTTYDAYFPMARTAATSASDGLLYNLKELKYLDLDNKSWNKMFNDALEFSGKLFYAAGSISTNSYDAVRLFMFNKDLIADNNLDNPYDLVRSGKWTFDALNNMAVAASADLNGDTTMGLEDQWGMAWQNSIGGTIFYFASGENITVMDDNNLPVVSIGSERSIEVYDRIKKMMSDKKTYYIGADADILTIFQEGRSLFLTEVLATVNTLRPFDVDFGLLPSPKYDASQDDYIQYVDGWCISPVVVPVNSVNPDRTGFIIQAIAEASSDYLTSAYYDIALTGKALRDNESAEMLDIIVNNFRLDNCDIYNWSGIWSKVQAGMASGDELSSIIAANKSALESSIKKTVDAIG